MVKQGDTFRPSDPSVNNHLYIILSDPKLNSQQVVMANLTSWRFDKDQSCVVEVGDHPFVTKRSCVHYNNKLITVSQYNDLLSASKLILNDPVSGTLLECILQGAAISPHLPLGHRQILVEQGFVDGE